MSAEVVTGLDWPKNRGGTHAKYRAIYQACHKLKRMPAAVVRCPLEEIPPAVAEKKAHWFFRRHFKIQTSTEDGFLYLRAAAAGAKQA